MTKKSVTAYLVLSLLLLAGCMYPEENLSKNQITNDEQLVIVQQAVNQYAEQTGGLLPIVTKDSDTPIYQKYVIDFSLLKQRSLLAEIPGSAFESGGTYQYVLIDVETDPTVKVIDLRVSNELREIQQRLSMFRAEHTYPPYGKKIDQYVYSLDYKELNLDTDPYVKSPYTGDNLPVYITTEGDLIIDYRSDIYRIMQENDYEYEEGDDIRQLLTDHFPVVPAYSIPYTIKEGEPVFANDL